jgi:hypothetical protein
MQDFNNHFTVVFPAVSSAARWEYNQSQEHLGTTVMPVNGWDSRSADMGPVSMILSGEPDPTEIESICFELKSDWAPIIHRGWDEPARDVVRSERQHAFHIGAERARQAEANGEGTFDACEQLVAKLDELMEAYRDGVFAFYHEACEAVLRHALGAQS